MSTKIAIIEPVGGHGGMNYYDFGLAQGLANAGAEVVLYTCDETAPPTMAGFTFETPFKKIYGKAHKAFRAINYMKGLLTTLINAKTKKLEIAHIHLFHTSIMELVTCYLIRLFGLKLAITVHDVESFSGDSSLKMTKKVFGLASTLIAHNNISRNEICRLTDISSTRIHVVPHGNYLNETSTQPSRSMARQALGINDDKKIILFFGQIKKVKGLDILLHAVSLLREKNINATALIAGKMWKDEFSTYQNLINELGINELVIKDIRYIPDNETPNYYAAADLVALPYRKIYQSGVLLMAMSYGRAVIASSLPGMREVISHKKDGLIFEDGNASDLANQIADAFETPNMLANLEKNGLQLMQEKYDWDLIAQKTLQAYKA